MPPKNVNALFFSILKQPSFDSKETQKEIFIQKEIQEEKEEEKE